MYYVNVKKRDVLSSNVPDYAGRVEWQSHSYLYNERK